MMLNTGGGMLYIAELDNETNYPANTCVGVNWMIDYNADENANVAQRGYYVASILQTPEIIEKGNAGYATDTLNNQITEWRVSDPLYMQVTQQ